MKLTNIIIVLITIIAIRSCSGCCEDPPEIPFDYRKMEIETVENMFSEKVFFEITISDTIRNYYAGQSYKPNFGFTNAHALSCPDPVYISNQQLKKIQVETLFPISSQIPAGQDVSSYFYGRSKLYISLDELIASMSNVYYQPQTSFTLFLKEKVENENAQFVITLNFSDGSVLIDTTKMINIIAN